MAINSVADLVIGQKYYLLLTEEDARYTIQVTLESIEYPTKLFPELSEITVTHPKLIMMVLDTHKVGIGETRKEAKANFGRLK